MKYIVLDLEATCGPGVAQSEIIEIGAVKINERGEIIGEFSGFIKPSINTELTSFCKELTSIQQEDIDSADSFRSVISRFIDWLGTDYILLSWGNYDKNQFIRDCVLNEVDTAWVLKHKSLKTMYALKKKIKRCGMEKALEIENIPLDGIHHRGIDDARNITKIFLKYFNDWDLH